MDYGQPTNPQVQEPFFTAGVGNAPEANNPDKNRSLNADVYSPERDPRSIGNTAITSSEQSTEIEAVQEAQEKSSEALGQIINLEMPPGVAQAEEANSTPIKPDYSINSVKTVNRLNEAGMKAVKAVEAQLTRDGNTEDFYNKIRGEDGLAETNLKNSFGRELAA